MYKNGKRISGSPEFMCLLTNYCYQQWNIHKVRAFNITDNRYIERAAWSNRNLLSFLSASVYLKRNCNSVYWGAQNTVRLNRGAAPLEILLNYGRAAKKQSRRYIKEETKRTKTCKEALLLKVPREEIVINCPLCPFQYICWTYFGPRVSKLNLSSFYQFISLIPMRFPFFLF